MSSYMCHPCLRSIQGAAGWVHYGSTWFVAKRVADAVRAWLKEHAPDESIPGDRKNDRLFDTWQEYGCIQVNPHTGQAVWYVTVHGEAGQGEQEAGQGSGQGANDGSVYTHNLTMLRFPLARLYDDASQYPPEMCGRIEVKPKRPDKPGAEEDLDAAGWRGPRHGGAGRGHFVAPVARVARVACSSGAERKPG